MGFSRRWCLYLLPAALASFAFITGFLFSFWCESIQFAPENSSSSSASVKMYGPWYQSDTVQTTTYVGGQERIFIRDVCVPFPAGTQIDSHLKAVRAFSIIAPIIGGLLTVGLWLAPCWYRFQHGSWRSLAIFFLVFMTLFQGLTFLIYSSSMCLDNPVLAMSGSSDLHSSECSWGQGSTSNAISVVLWFLTGAAMLAVGCPERPPRGPPETQTVTYQQTTNPDGTTTVSEVAVVKGTAVPPPAVDPKEMPLNP